VPAFLASLEQFGIKLGLDQIRALVEAMGRPDRDVRSIVVAGTNGKGSVTAMVERALRAAGFRTGRYISPHLVAVNERFAIDGRPIDDGTLAAAAARVEAAAARLPHPPSYFEATTAIAFDVFRDADVDLAVLEVGLGGRLDATNIVDPVAVAITSIDLDHQAQLGDTAEAIAAEKAGVIKRGVLAVLGENPPHIREVVQRTAARAGGRLVYAPTGVELDVTLRDGRAEIGLTTPRGVYAPMTLALRGRHQVVNAITAVRLLEEISAHGIAPVPPDAVRIGLERVVWPARLELLRWRGHDVLIDGAHNPAGAWALAAYLREVYRAPVPMVIGAMKDKAIDAMLAAILPVARSLTMTAAASDRAFEPEALVTAARTLAPGVEAVAVADPLEAVAAAAAQGSPVVVAGSLYLAGAVRQAIGG
jgi:dihydrofolate synthase/folylpolyglutamate synthase